MRAGSKTAGFNKDLMGNARIVRSLLSIPAFALQIANTHARDAPESSSGQFHQGGCLYPHSQEGHGTDACCEQERLAEFRHGAPPFVQLVHSQVDEAACAQGLQ